MAEEYDAGLLSDYGGGDVNWWQDYIRAEIGRANDYHYEIHNRNESRIKDLENALQKFKSGDWGETNAILANACRKDLAKSLSEKNVMADSVLLKLPY